MKYPIHIWTEEEIENLEEVKFERNQLLPFEEIKQKVKNGERLDLPSLFEKESSGTTIIFYGLVQGKHGVILSNIIPGVGYIESDLKKDLNDEDETSSLILFDLLTVNPDWYKNRKEISKDKDVNREVRLLKLQNGLLDPTKHPWIDA